MKNFCAAFISFGLLVSNHVGATALTASIILVEPFPLLEGTISSVGDELSAMPESIRFGVSYGECLEHCATSYSIQKNPSSAEYSVVKEVRASDGSLEKTDTKSLAPVSWALMAQRANYNQFSLLKLEDPSKNTVTFGCPGCADGPIHWVSLSYDNGASITFVYEDVQDITIANTDLTLFKQYYLSPLLVLLSQIEKEF
jgi:hypothetical protein